MSDPTANQSQQNYKRVMLKISGESLMGNLPYGIDSEMVGTVAQQVKDVVAKGIEVCLVIGGGNIFRGFPGLLRAWNGPPVTTWACWQP